MEQLKDTKIKVVFTGGHAATTAVAVIEEIHNENLNWEIYWIGVENAIEGKKVATLESDILPKFGVKFLPLVMGRIQRRFTFWTVPSILKIPVGFVHSLYYLIKIRPSVVLSFGGFASFPVVVNAKLLGIPVIVHEQTSSIGRSNKLAIRFASKIAISRNESLVFYPKEKCVVTGNPVMREIEKIKPKIRISNPPIIFVTGGSRGSQSVNNVIEKILRTLLSKYKVIHQTGGLDYRKFSDIKQNLPQALRDNYEVFVRVNPIEVSDKFSRSDIVVARAGANTVSELMIVKRPAILVPLPISYMDEQTRNANIAQNFGVAKIISQSDLNSEILIKTIESIISNYSKIVDRIKTKLSPDLGASKRLVSIIKEYIR